MGHSRPTAVYVIVPNLYPPEKMGPRVPPFKVTQGRGNRKRSIGYIQLSISDL